MPQLHIGKSSKERDLVCIGGSAGAVHVISEILCGLPPDFSAAVLVVIHTSPASPGILPEILDRAGPLSATMARDGQKIRIGFIYVAPPDQHMLVEGDRIRLGRGPKESGFRPAVDPLFRTAAETFGARVIGIVVSGGLDDGTKGLLAIKRNGGIAVVQDPVEAAFPSMPGSAVRYVDVDHVLPGAEISAVLARLTSEPIAAGKVSHASGNGKDIAEQGTSALRTDAYGGPPSGFTCPGCGGALWELRDGEFTHYRCHVGHDYTADGLWAYQSEALESALWSALRALEEHAALNHRLAERSEERWPLLRARYEELARDAESRANVIRRVLVGKTAPGLACQEPAASIVEFKRNGKAKGRGMGGPPMSWPRPKTPRRRKAVKQ